MLYSLGYQDFRSLREDGRTYVDKTRHIADILDINKYLFLARPRRFGKSLTVSTLAELHSGDRALFKGLWAYGNWNFEARHSKVIWLQFASSHFAVEGLEAGLHNMIDLNAERLALAIPDRTSASYSARFAALIKKAAAASPSGKTVLLVDEYDKPIVNYIGEQGGEDILAVAVENRNTLKIFYSVLKDADPHLRLVFITGVTAFSKVSIFSDLNNVTNLTLHRSASTLLGITETELNETYAQQLKSTGIPPTEVRKWYNGYKFAPKATKVYNPWSLLSFLEEGRLKGYWFETGTPTWLTRMILNSGSTHISGSVLSESQLINFSLDKIELIPVLFQTGYLTITDYTDRRNLYTLDYPNIEVQQALELELLRSAQRPGSLDPSTRISN